ncbi:Fc.00g074210.m01.CDS01 [Cosmosporella sp. VM-42]
MAAINELNLDPSKRIPLLRDDDSRQGTLPIQQTFRGDKNTNPQGSDGGENASVSFIGTATTLIEWQGLRILTDPNFLHAGDHVHLGPGVTAQRRTNPAVDLHELPPVDCILLSHYHEDHFDRLVEQSLNREFPIITTPHAKGCLTSTEDKDEPFHNVKSLDFFESLIVTIPSKKKTAVKISGMPGKHVPPGPLAAANNILKAVPPTNGWLLEFGSPNADSTIIDVGYRIYISGDTLFVDELKEIPARLKDEKIDLMLIHLGGTTIPGPNLPLLMVTMDAKQGLQLMQLMDPDVTIPIHFDDYDVFTSPLSDFKDAVDEAGWQKRVVYLDRGDQYLFKVGEGGANRGKARCLSM